MAGRSSVLRSTHASGLHAVGRELAALHNEMLRAGGDDPRMVRLSVLNLVAVCQDAEAAETAAQTVAAIAQIHPARTIVVFADSAGEAAIEADLALQATALGNSGQVCSEQLCLRVRGEPALHLASVITPLLVPDVPVHLWLVGSPPLEQALAHDAVALCEQLIVDLDEYEDAPHTLAQLARASARAPLPLADLAWARSRPWRERIAQSFDGPAMRHFARHVVEVVVESGGDGPAGEAWLLAGWIDHRMAERQTRPPRVLVTAEDGAAAGTEHVLQRVSLRCEDGEHTAWVRIVRDGSMMRTVVEIDGGLSASTTVGYAVPAAVELVGALVEGAVVDGIYLDALQRSAALAAEQG